MISLGITSHIDEHNVRSLLGRKLDPVGVSCSYMSAYMDGKKRHHGRVSSCSSVHARKSLGAIIREIHTFCFSVSNSYWDPW